MFTEREAQLYKAKYPELQPGRYHNLRTSILAAILTIISPVLLPILLIIKPKLIYSIIQDKL